MTAKDLVDAATFASTPSADPRLPRPAAPGPRRARGGAHVVVRGADEELPSRRRACMPVLRGIDLELRPGEMVAVVGASGAGKSTLLHVLGTLDPPTAGDDPLRRRRRRHRRCRRRSWPTFRNRAIGFVFQFHHLLPEFTALENAMMPALIMRLPRARVRRARHDDARRAWASRTGSTHRPGELSGGEQQRVALARALVLEPRAAARRRADRQPRHRRPAARCTSCSSSSTASCGMTMLVVTHNPELAAQTAAPAAHGRRRHRRRGAARP